MHYVHRWLSVVQVELTFVQMLIAMLEMHQSDRENL